MYLLPKGWSSKNSVFTDGELCSVESWSTCYKSRNEALGFISTFVLPFFCLSWFCSGEATKFGRNDSSSPAPPTTLSTAGVQSQPQQTQQTGTQGQGQSQGQQTQNQAFLNPPLPPGYGYTGKGKTKSCLITSTSVILRFYTINHLHILHHFTGLPYYAGMPGVPSAFQYAPTVFVPPASAKQPAMGLANPSNQYHQQHQPSYGQHAYGTGKSWTKQGFGWFVRILLLL